MTTPDIDDPMLGVIGKLAVNAQQPPDGTPCERLAWRCGYQNAMADLIDDLYPGAVGGGRLTMADIATQDERRRLP